jgi:hypothetical protein
MPTQPRCRAGDAGVMTFALLLLAVFSFWNSAAASDDAACRERFIRHFVDRTKLTGVKIHVTQRVKGGPTTENWNYQAAPGRWMSEMIKPAGLPWTLVHDNVMYSSRDKGKSWEKVRTLDSAQRAEDVAADLQATVSTIRNATCGVEQLGGVRHETLAADYTQPKYATEHRDTYWVNPETGWMAKATTTTVGKGYEMSVTQLIEPAAGLQLPRP